MLRYVHYYRLYRESTVPPYYAIMQLLLSEGHDGPLLPLLSDHSLLLPLPSDRTRVGEWQPAVRLPVSATDQLSAQRQKSPSRALHQVRRPLSPKRQQLPAPVSKGRQSERLPDEKIAAPISSAVSSLISLAIFDISKLGGNLGAVCEHDHYNSQGFDDGGRNQM